MRRMNSFFLLLGSLCFCLNAWEPLPEARICERPASCSRWLWNRDEKVAKGAKSYFRYRFTIPEKIRGAEFRAQFDDSGDIYLNGRKTAPGQVAKNLKQGENLLAFQCNNGSGGAGLLFYGSVTLDSGKTVHLHSDETVRAAARPADGWEKPGFDDSAWKTALDQGDVLAQPWSRWRNYVSGFTTPAERAKIDAAVKKATTISPEIAKTPAPDAKIVYQGFIPKISVNGKLYDPVLNMRGDFDEANNTFALKAADAGVKIVQIGLTDQTCYKGKGVRNFTGIDRQARRILHLIPDARLFVAIWLGQPSPWYKENPGEMIGYAAGPVQGPDAGELYGRPARPSAASEKFRSYVRDSLTAFAAYIRSRPWANRVIGVRVNYGTYAEWHSFGMYNGPDTSPVMTAKFRAWLKEKYRTGENLRKAWNDPAVTFETATVPTMAERSPEGALLDPAKSRKTIDYFDCFTSVNADLLLMAAGVIKKELPGRLCGAYYGYVLSTHPPEGSNILLDKVLSSPSIDFASNPAPYTGYARLAGGSFPHRTIPAAFRRYGKLAILEDDSRFHQLPRFTEKAFSARTPRESRMVARRNICNMIFDGTGLQIHDASKGSNRQHTFDDPEVMTGVKEALAAMKKAGPVSAESGNQCAVVIDCRERLRVSRAKSGRSLLNSIYAVAKPHLDRSGIPYDLMTLQDLLASKQNYSTVVFLNLFSLSETERKAVQARIRRPGVTAVWLVAPGSATGKGFSDSAMSELTGIELTGAGTLPQVKCVDPAVKKLPGGAVVKTLPDRSRAVFAAAVPNSGTKWRDLLKALGVHAYTAPENYFRRQGNLFMFHTGRKGPHTITLPEKSGVAVELFSGRKYPAPAIEIRSEGPGTWLFRLQ